MSTCTSDANRRRDVTRDFGLAYETKNASAALRCYKAQVAHLEFRLKWHPPSRNLDFGLDS